MEVKRYYEEMKRSPTRANESIDIKVSKASHKFLIIVTVIYFPTQAIKALSIWSVVQEISQRASGYTRWHFRHEVFSAEFVHFVNQDSRRPLVVQ